MEARAFTLVGATCAAGMFVSIANAGFSELVIRAFDGGDDAAMWAAQGHDGLTTYRLYATFDGGADDGVISGFGIGGLPASASSYDGAFYNDIATGGNTAPLDLRAAGLWSNQWDTYVTINATLSAGDATATSPGFGTETLGLAEDWTSENMGWFVTPDDAQSAAVDGEVYLGQFTVAAGGENTPGNPDVSGVIHLLLLDGTQAENLAFSSGVPTPGALALLGLAGLAGTRRRRA